MQCEAPLFANRVDAGRRLAGKLSRLRGQDLVVLGLPRGGVPVAAQVAEALHAPLDVIVVRKLGTPRRPELGMGALGEGGVRVLNQQVIDLAAATDKDLAAVERTELAALHRRARLVRGDRPAVDLTGRTAVIVDDGLATGSTARAAGQVARARGASRVILAVPLAPVERIEPLLHDFDEVVCVQPLTWMSSVGQWYEDFSPTSDEEVRALLAQAGRPEPARHSPDPAPVRDLEVVACPETSRLPGHLTLPAGAGGLVVFAHGSGSNRRSRRNQHMASVLHRSGLGTLLFDLLSGAEAADQANVCDIPLLARRLADVTAWVRDQPWGRTVPIGWFGASTGAAAALWAAAEPHADVAAIVSRGGRPDLARPRLAAVAAPTLLIVGGLDTEVLAANRGAEALLRCPHELVVVPGATHLFDEPGTLAAAAHHARGWFLDHLCRDTHPVP